MTLPGIDSILAPTLIILVIVAVMTAIIGLLVFGYFRKMTGRGKDARRIATTGMHGQGRILAVRQTSVMINNQPVVDIDLEVHPANSQPPYRTTVRRVVSLFQIAQFQQGAVLPLKFDPADPSQVVLLV